MQNNELYSAYHSIFKMMEPPPELDGINPPLLLHLFEEWQKCDSKVMMFGQETMGWDFGPNSYYPWTYPRVKWFKEFWTLESREQAFIEGYKWFEFAEKQKDNYSSPFWRMYRELLQIYEKGNKRAIIWNNLVKTAFEGKSMFKSTISEAKISFMINISRTLIRKELQILNPKVCLFFTGPYYDEVLKEVFPDIQFQEYTGYPMRFLCRLESSFLPKNSLRTYHPNYLSRSKKWNAAIMGIKQHSGQ